MSDPRFIFIIEPKGTCFDCGEDFANGVRCTIKGDKDKDCRCFPCFSQKVCESFFLAQQARNKGDYGLH